MDSNTIVAVLVSVIAVSVGQVLFKIASGGMSEHLKLASITTLLLNPYFVAAIVIYALSTLLWAWVLRHVELNKAYPFLALSFVLVPLAGIVLFGEKASMGLVVGSGLILAGICIIARWA